MSDAFNVYKENLGDTVEAAVEAVYQLGVIDGYNLRQTPSSSPVTTPVEGV
jgi:hypothetical protein